MTTKDVERDDRESLGPAMQACSERERLFVMAKMEGHNNAESARRAGCECSSAENFARVGLRFSHRPRVIDALIECARKEARNTLPHAVNAIREIVTAPFHKDRAKVALNLLERVDPTVTKQEIEVTHKFDPVKTTLDFLASLKARGWTREQLLAEFSPFELDHYEKLLAVEDHRIVDAEYVEIQDPDQDILGE